MLMMLLCVVAQLDDWLMVYVPDVPLCVLAQLDDWLMVYVHYVSMCVLALPVTTNISGS